jgi:hypothetical protein
VSGNYVCISRLLSKTFAIHNLHPKSYCSFSSANYFKLVFTIKSSNQLKCGYMSMLDVLEIRKVIHRKRIHVRTCRSRIYGPRNMWNRAFMRAESETQDIRLNINARSSLRGCTAPQTAVYCGAVTRVSFNLIKFFQMKKVNVMLNGMY